MALPCPDIAIGGAGSALSRSFNDALVVTDADFSSREDCQALAGFFQGKPLNGQAGNALSGSGLDYSKLDALVEQVWQPEVHSDVSLFYRVILDWLKAFGLDVDSDAIKGFIQTYLPSAGSLMLFAKLAAGLLVVVLVIFLLRNYYRRGGFSLRRRRANGNLAQPAQAGAILTPVSIIKLPLREQAAALLRYSIELLRRQQQIPLSACYTNHELLAYLADDDCQRAALLSRQIRLTEPVIYGDRPVTEAELAQAWQINRAIAACEAQS